MTPDEQLSVLTVPNPKTKYVLHYATDVTKPRGAAPSEMIELRSIFHLLRVVLFHKGARAAVLASRFRVLKIDRKRKK